MIPGFVDSHTHLVFAGDRADEFAARMAGQPYAAGGIQVTTDATRAASVEELTALAEARRDEALRAGITHIEIKSGYGLETETERALVRGGGRPHRRRHLPRRPRRPRRNTRAVPTTTSRSSAARCSRPARRSRAGSTSSASAAPSTESSRGRCWRRARGAGLGLRVHGNQLGPGPGVRLAVELGAASVDHCTYLDDADIEALAGGDTVATFLPATDFSTRQPYPDARRVIDAGARVALATNCNPGSSYTTSMAFCIALAVRDMNMTAEEALQAATLGGANALRRDDVGRLAPGRSRRRGRPRRPLLHPPRLPSRRPPRRRGHRGRATTAMRGAGRVC